MKKVLSLLLAVWMLFSSVPAVFAAFADEANWPSSVSWAKSQINYMVEKGVLNGYAEDNTFRPADPVTRVQFIKMIVETFGLTKTAAVSYTDVKSTDWFYPYVQKAAAQGFLLNYGTELDPNGQLTREEAAALLVRYLALDESKKSPSSTYKDYGTIKIKYQDYVLQATYEGLFNGDETGNFSPTRILRRCEAAAILYRAAGTIYKASATGTDAGAANANAVIAKPGVIVNDADIVGELYISEGASGGVVMLSGCDLETVIIRGSASVTFTDCDIKTLIVDCTDAAYTVSVTLNEGTKVAALNAKTPVKASAASGTEVTAMTVASGAKNSSLTGSGTLKGVTVNASGFKSEMMPGKYTVASGLSASFAGTSYTGTADASASGFVVAPTMYTTTANGYLTGKPSVSGYVYYYYTNTASVPAAANFMSLYNSASVKDSFLATANVPFDKDIGTAASISAYSYVAVMLQSTNGTTKYQPVLLPNRASSGFKSAPALSVSGTYDKLTVTSTVKGYVYYYYAKTNTAPTVDTFSTMYNAAVYKGEIAVNANQQASKNTVLTSTVASYPYLVVIVMDASGNRYQPTVISKSGTNVGSTDTGFVTSPFVSKNGEDIYLGFAASKLGTVEYYYTTSSTLPTAAQFASTYAATAASAKGSISVSTDSYYQALPNQIVARAYKYIVLRMTASGVTYQPVLVVLPVAGSANLAGTGFSATPTSYMTSGYFYLTVQATSSGQLFYYITNNATAPSVSEFETNWANKTGTYLEDPSGGACTLRAGTQNIKTDIKNEIGINCSYIVLMSVIGSTKMTPVLIPLVGGTNDPAQAQPTTTGFVGTPYCSTPFKRAHQTTVTPNVSNGKIYYYYTDSNTVPLTSDVKRIVEAEMSAGSGTGSYAGIYSISGKKTYDIQVTIVNEILPKYVVLMLVDGSGTEYLPVVVPTSGGSGNNSGTTENMAGTGFSVKPTAKLSGSSLTLTYTMSAAGQLLYYFSTSSVAPVDSASFVNTYYTTGLSGSMLGTFSVNAGSGTKTITAPIGYAYLVIMLQKANVATNETPFCQPIVVPVSGTTSGTTTVGTGFYNTPYVSGDYLHYYPRMTGQLRYYFTNTDTIGDFSQSLEELEQAALTAGTVQITSLTQKQLYIPTATALGVYAKNFKNIVVWMDNGTTTTDPIFVPLEGGTGNSGNSGNTGTQPASATGFSSDPDLEGVILFFTPNVTGTLKYFYTNSNNTYTNATFTGTYPYQVQSGTGYSKAVTKGASNFIDVTAGASYKYLWVMLDTGSSTYTPVRIQLH